MRAQFVLEAVLLRKSLSVPYWVESADASFLWLLPNWSLAGVGRGDQTFRFDMCTYNPIAQAHAHSYLYMFGRA